MRKILMIGVVFVALLFMINIVSISVEAAVDGAASSGVITVLSTKNSPEDTTNNNYWWDFSKDDNFNLQKGLQKGDILTMELREETLKTITNRVIFKHHGPYNDHCAIATGETRKGKNIEKWGNYTSYQFIDAPGPNQKVRYCWYPDDFDYWANEYALFRVNKEEYPQYNDNWDSILNKVIEFCGSRVLAGNLYQDYSNLSSVINGGNDTSIVAVANPYISYTRDADNDNRMICLAADRSKERWYCSELIWAAYAMSTENPTVYNYLGICELDSLPYWHPYRVRFNDPEKIVLIGVSVNSIIDNEPYVIKLWSAKEEESSPATVTISESPQITEIKPLIEENVISNIASEKTNHVINNFVNNVMKTHTGIKNNLRDNGKIENQDISDSRSSNFDTKVEKIQIVNTMVGFIKNVIKTNYQNTNAKTVDIQKPAASSPDTESNTKMVVESQADIAPLTASVQNTNECVETSVENEEIDQVISDTNTETAETEVSIEEVSSIAEEKITTDTTSVSETQSSAEVESQSESESISVIVSSSTTQESSTDETTETINFVKSANSLNIKLTSS